MLFSLCSSGKKTLGDVLKTYFAKVNEVKGSVEDSHLSTVAPVPQQKPPCPMFPLCLIWAMLLQLERQCPLVVILIQAVLKVLKVLKILNDC